jgi:hypothetical protein
VSGEVRKPTAGQVAADLRAFAWQVATGGGNPDAPPVEAPAAEPSQRERLEQAAAEAFQAAAQARAVASPPPEPAGRSVEDRAVDLLTRGPARTERMRQANEQYFQNVGLSAPVREAQPAAETSGGSSPDAEERLLEDFRVMYSALGLEERERLFAGLIDVSTDIDVAGQAGPSVADYLRRAQGVEGLDLDEDGDEVYEEAEEYDTVGLLDSLPAWATGEDTEEEA